MNSEELFKLKISPKKDDLTDDDIAKLFFKYKGLLKKLERDEAFWVATNENITRAYLKLDKQTRELLETQEKLTRQERLAIFGRSIGGITHEFNNILTAITGATEIALENVKNDLSKQMLDFSRVSKIVPKIVELEAFFREAQEIFYVLFHKNIIIDYKINPCKLKIDPNQLQQIMLNLLLNSRDAMPEQGKVNISASIVKSNVVKDFEVNKIRRGDYAHIQVTDNGIGMSKEVLSKVFEPFYTTKPAGKGTGLGLSQVYGIVRLYRGYTYIESEKGKGTKYHLYFPVKLQ